jgi:hypothetical protein
MRIELPSGASGQARRLKTGDLADLAEALEDDQLGDEGAFALIRSAWLQVDDPGPYPEDVMAFGTAQPDWARVLKGDLVGALLQIRIGSLREGYTYEFDVPCEHSKKCPPIKWEIDLRESIIAKVKRLPDTSRDHVRSGEPLVTHLYNPESEQHDGPAVSFRLQTVAAERPIEELRKKQLEQKRRKSNQTNVIDQLAAQITKVEGQSLQNERQVWQWVRALDWDDALDLQAAFEEADCGYETEIEVMCKQCRRPQQNDLPLQKSFLVPSRRRSKADDSEAASAFS